MEEYDFYEDCSDSTPKLRKNELYPKNSQASSTTLATFCTDSDFMQLSSSCLPQLDNQDCAKSSKNITGDTNLLKKKSKVALKQRRTNSQKICDLEYGSQLTMPMIGIDEASNEEEQSPEPRKNGLGVISEETGGYVFPKVKDTKEVSISKFLDTLQIHQVFPSEVNMIRLKFMSQHDIPVPKLSLRNNKLLIKRKSDKLITLSGLM